MTCEIGIARPGWSEVAFWQSLVSLGHNTVDYWFSTLHAQLQNLRLCAQGIYFLFWQKWMAWKSISWSAYLMPVSWRIHRFNVGGC